MIGRYSRTPASTLVISRTLMPASGPSALVEEAADAKHLRPPRRVGRGVELRIILRDDDVSDLADAMNGLSSTATRSTTAAATKRCSVQEFSAVGNIHDFFWTSSPHVLGHSTSAKISQNCHVGSNVSRGQKQREVKRNARIILILACIQASFSIYHHITSTCLETLNPLEMIAETVLITLPFF